MSKYICQPTASGVLDIVSAFPQYCLQTGAMFSSRISLIVALLYFSLDPISAVDRSSSVKCAAQNPPIRRSTDCFHAIGLMTNTLHPLTPAAFRYGECLLLLHALYRHPPPPQKELALPLPEGMLYLRAEPVNPADMEDSFDHSLLLEAKASAAAILQVCLPGEVPELGWALGRYRPSNTNYYFVALKTVPEDMPMGILQWEIKPRPGQDPEPSDAQYHVYHPPGTAVEAGPSTSWSPRDGDSGASSSGASTSGRSQKRQMRNRALSPNAREGENLIATR